MNTRIGGRSLDLLELNALLMMRGIRREWEGSVECGVVGKGGRVTTRETLRPPDVEGRGGS